MIVLLTIKFQKYFLALGFFSNEINRQTIRGLILSYPNETDYQSVAESDQLRAKYFLNREILFALPAVFVNSGSKLKLFWINLLIKFMGVFEDIGQPRNVSV